MRTLLLDADILAFTVSARSETKIDWEGDGNVSRTADIEQAKTDLRNWINELTETLKADEAIVCLSTPPYFRKSIYPGYKMNRTSGETPLLLLEIKEYLRGPDFRNKFKPGLEADDILGIYATHPTLLMGERVICTSDKDLRQIAGLHFNLRKPAEGIFEISQQEADDFFYTQILTGDPTDGYPGCPKIGPVRAAKILAEAEEAFSFDTGLHEQHQPYTKQEPPALGDYRWRAIVAAYEKAGLDEAYALTQAQVARILRHDEFDYTNQKAIPWTPATSS